MIIEDEPLAREILEKYIEEMKDLELVLTVEDGEEAFHQVGKHEVDLIFLDVNLPKLSGLNFYRSLANKPKVIFTTAYSEYAVEGFELEAIDYLLKPFSFDRFQTAVEKARAALSNQTDEVLVIREDKKLYRIPYSEILYIESIRDYVKVYTTQKTLISSDTLRHLSDTLPKPIFLRVHKSFIVSVSAIDYMEGNQLIINDKKIPVGHSFREEVAKFFKK